MRNLYRHFREWISNWEIRLVMRQNKWLTGDTPRLWLSISLRLIPSFPALLHVPPDCGLRFPGRSNMFTGQASGFVTTDDLLPAVCGTRSLFCSHSALFTSRALRFFNTLLGPVIPVQCLKTSRWAGESVSVVSEWGFTVLFLVQHHCSDWTQSSDSVCFMRGL